MSKINEYPQAVTINNNDLFVIDQESGGDHATKSASVSQIADKATSGVQSQIGDLSQLSTSVTSSLVGAVNEVDRTKVENSVETKTLVPNATYYKMGKVVQVSLITYSVPANTGGYSSRHVIGYLPVGYRPIVNAYVPYISNDIRTLMIQASDGEVSIRNSSGSAQDAFVSITFFTN